MFLAGISIGIFSYILFFLGIFHLLYPQLLITLSATYLVCLFGYLAYRNRTWHAEKISLLEVLFVGLFLLQVLVNLVGVLGPEIAFDATWYHLTIPKLYLMHQAIYFIPGSLLSYNTLPRLTEVLYTAGLSFGTTLVPKFIHFSFGILCCVLVFKLARLFVSKNLAIIAILIFYANPVVGWESITAYNDLTVTFFSLLSFYAFGLYYIKKKLAYALFSGLFLGLAVATKILAGAELVIFVMLLLYGYWQKELSRRQVIVAITFFLFFTIAIPLPYFLFSFFNTHNFVYPLFSQSLTIGSQHASILTNFFTLFLAAPDPISPVYIAIIPFLFFLRFKKNEMPVFLYSCLALIVWFCIPQIGGGRFILPYVPVWSVLVVLVLQRLTSMYYKGLLIFILLISMIGIGYRGLANAKYIPVIIGRETQTHFLTTHLNFMFGDFVDSDGYFTKHIKPTDKVLLIGFHNLYYVNFPFIESSSRNTNDTFNFVAIQNTHLPSEFIGWRKVYQNVVTHVTLYERPNL